MSCPCDTLVHPLPLDIQPGLDRLLRQVAGFPQFREAMLHDVGAARYAAAFGAWSGTGPNDLGIMLIEMWAYVADVLAFYDEVHAHECYLRTARREALVRDLVARLGYQPRPAVASVVELVLLGDGRRALTLPAGTAFRSGAFDDEPPQVFEFESDLAIHPLRNSWSVEAPRPATVDAPGGPEATASSFLLAPARSAKWVEGELMLVQPDPAVDSTWQPAFVIAAESMSDEANERWLEVGVDREIAFGAGRSLDGVRFLRPTKSATLWLQPPSGSVAASTLALDAIHRDLRAGDLVLVQCTRTGFEGLRWFRVTEVAESTRDVVVAEVDGVKTTAKIPVTMITLDADLSVLNRGTAAAWGEDDAGWLVVHHGLRDAGRLGAPQQSTLGSKDPIALANTPTPVDDTASTRFALQDVDGIAVAGDGTVDFASGTLSPASSDEDDARPVLTLPVTAFGNLGQASRGETVSDEVLGSGDATLSNQSFELKKAPLTFVPSATAAAGRVSTLTVRVDGVAWTEAASFYGAGAEDAIFVVRVDADGVATVTFGDGSRGARLPTGTDNVVASYRKGAGAAAPPAGSIAQIARGAAGLLSVKQPFAAYGGADREDPEDIRTNAPRQALTLGRAVSILDMEAFAAACTGVRAVSARWSWDARSGRPAVKVWVVGDGDVAATVRARLLAVSDPATPIAVAAAAAIPISATIAVTCDAAYDGGTVDAAVASVLLDSGGVLTVEQLGIGLPIYFSRLYEAMHSVAGVRSVSLAWDRSSGTVGGYGDAPGEGAYFDLSAGITINSKGYPSG